MQQFKFLLFILFLCFLPISLYAEDTAKPQVIPIRKKTTDVDHSRPKKPANIYFMVSYNEDGTWVFDLPANVEYLMVEVCNVETQECYLWSVTVDDNIWYQSIPKGSYFMNCTVDNGDTYEAEFDI